MKRYRVLPFFDFDTRATILTSPINENWETEIKNQHYENRKKTLDILVSEFGELDKDEKVENFIALGSKPFSILAFHNRFFNQIRNSFVIGAYYPALTATCALGERILNYLLLTLRDDYKGMPEYKKIYQKDSFDDWDVPIKTLESWDILLPNVVENFYKLKEMRNKAIHFRPETDNNDKNLALDAINCMKEIIGNQFSSWGNQPWFITNVSGELYIKSDWEKKPFVRKIYLPNCAFVGFRHKILSIAPKVMIDDNFEYTDVQISDNEFCKLRIEQQNRT
jgi:hypothetical protein